MANPLHVVALGASAGGLEAIRDLVGGLDTDFPAAILVCVHTSPVTGSARIELLARQSKLPASLAVEGEKLRAGHVYLAPPDHHLLVTAERLLVRRGPIENNARPAIDPLFRSVAVAFGPRALGVVLSGFVSQDGVSGLQAIKRCGGTTMVQHPDDAEYEGMPEEAIRLDSPDHVVPVADMPALLRSWIAQPKAATPDIPPEIVLEVRIASQDEQGLAPPDKLGSRSMLTCPECHGVLWEVDDGDLVRYRCHLGHAYSPLDLSVAQLSEVERALASALRAINERIGLLRRMAEQARVRQQTYSVRAWEERIAEYERQSTAIRALLLANQPELGSGRDASMGKKRAT
jgi:two-component system chemotaxis response regulator CheB